MPEVIDQMKWGGVCAFVSVLHGLRTRGGIKGLGKELSTADLDKQLGAEMVTYLKMTQVERPAIADGIVAFTKTWGPKYAGVTMTSLIEDIKEAATNKFTSGDWDGQAGVGCALPPPAVEDYLKFVDLKFKRTLDGTRFPFTQEVMGKYKDCLVGTGATSEVNNGWKGLRHWVYVRKDGTMLNWGVETKMSGGVAPPYDPNATAVMHDMIVYAIQLL